MAGPLTSVPLEYVSELRRSTVRYKREDEPLQDGRWPYRMRMDESALPEDARPPASRLARSASA
ncbi:hypothetical protein [Streptomyces mirabilis]|uniref:hypothetical protein n=1 Tax=Streptomyces mirabilis TaxID=68239 RepID=UPI0036CB262C